MTDKLLRLPLDRTKRHFVLGDLHGMYDDLLRLLKVIDYDQENDIIYSVGDLVDRGPKSVECVEFFTNQKNRYAALGNHEYMSISPMWMNVWYGNGAPQTIASLHAHGKDENWLRDIVSTWPLIIEVGDIDEEDCFRIVHADYDRCFSDDDAERMLNQATDEDGYFDGEHFEVASLLWSRETISKGLDNLKTMKPIHYQMDFNPNRKRHNYVGHSAVRKPLTIRDITFIDTMWFGKKLTMVEVLSGESFSVKVDV